MSNSWKRKVDSLLRLAEDQRGKPEGDVAKAKLAQILERHPEARSYQPVQDFILADLRYMRHNNISTDGVWEGRNFQEAIQAMVADYRARIDGHQKPKRLKDRKRIEASKHE